MQIAQTNQNNHGLYGYNLKQVQYGPNTAIFGGINTLKQ